MSLERETERAARLAERLLHHPALALPGPGISLGELDPCARMDQMIAALLTGGSAPERAGADDAGVIGGEMAFAASRPSSAAVTPGRPGARPATAAPPLHLPSRPPVAAIRPVPAPDRREPGPLPAWMDSPRPRPSPAAAGGLDDSALPPTWKADPAAGALSSALPETRPTVAARPGSPPLSRPAPSGGLPEELPAAAAHSPAGATASVTGPEPASGTPAAPPATAASGKDRAGSDHRAAPSAPSTPRAPALRLAASPKELAALLESHVTPAGPEGDPEVAALWPWARETSAAAPSATLARPEAPGAAAAVPSPPPARPAALPPEIPGRAPRAALVEEQVVDAVLERLEDRMREESIRRFGLTGGDL